MVVEDSICGAMHGILPMMHMQPEMDYEPDPTYYKSPCYKTGVRAGVLSTTGKTGPSLDDTCTWGNFFRFAS